jgi:hypothetical protein
MGGGQDCNNLFNHYLVEYCAPIFFSFPDSIRREIPCDAKVCSLDPESSEFILYFYTCAPVDVDGRILCIRSGDDHLLWYLPDGSIGFRSIRGLALDTGPGFCAHSAAATGNPAWTGSGKADGPADYCNLMDITVKES